MLAFTLLLAAGAVQAQEPGRIAGTVEEARGGGRLEGVNVVVVGTLYAAVTDAEGRFVLGPMPPGTYAVEINALGFRTERRDVILAAGAEAELAFRLRLPEVEVERIDAAALRRVLQPVEAVEDRHLREINAHETGELLRALPGTDAGRRSVLDFEPFIRGLGGNQIGVYVEGARFLAGSPFGFSAPLSLFDPSVVEWVDVVKGPYALTWGGGNLSAIRVTTRDAPAGTRLRPSFQAGYTSKLDALDAAGSLSGSSGKASYRLHGAYRSGDDYKDGGSQRIPADFRAVTLRGQAAYRFRTSTRFVLQAGYQDRGDLDAPGSVLSQGASDAADVSARFQTAWAAGPIRALDATVYWNRRAQRLEDSVAPDLSRPKLLALDVEQAQVGGRLAARFVPVKGWTLEAGGDVYSVLHDAVRQISGVASRNPEVFLVRDARITDAGFFAGGTRVFGTLEATGTVRLDVVHAQAELDVPSDYASVTETNLSGAFALTAGLSSVWQASAGIGSVARSAGAYERYADPASFRNAFFLTEVAGNPGLEPERSTQADLWLSASYPRLELHLNAFARRLSNAITVPPSPDYIEPPNTLPELPRYVNGKATYYGAEMAARYALMGEFVTIHGAARYLWGRNDLLREPAYGVAPAHVMMGGRLNAPANLFFLEGILRGVFEQTRVARSRVEGATDGYITADLHFGVMLPRAASLVLGVNNLTGKTYANHLNVRLALSAQPITEPGRVFFIRLRYGI